MKKNAELSRNSYLEAWNPCLSINLWLLNTSNGFFLDRIWSNTWHFALKNVTIFLQIVGYCSHRHAQNHFLVDTSSSCFVNAFIPTEKNRGRSAKLFKIMMDNAIYIDVFLVIESTEKSWSKWWDVFVVFVFEVANQIWEQKIMKMVVKI